MTREEKRFHKVALLFIIVVALFARTINIDTAPPGLYPDEANNATNAYDAQLSGNYEWFYPDNNGREGMYINLMAVSFAWFGVSPFSLKLPSILFGVLAVLGIYFFTRELFRSRPRIALIAAFLMSVSFWAVNFSRIGFRAIAMLPIMLFSFYFIFRGIRTKKFYNYIIAGALFGLGFHTYIAFRIAPALLLALLVLFLIIDRQFLKNYWKAIGTFVLSAFIVVAPLLLTFHAHPEYLSSRTSDVSIFASDEPLIPALTKTIGISLGQFNVYGDPNWRHNFPPHALLEPLTGLAFLIGIVMSIGVFFRQVRLRITEGVRNKQLVSHGFLLAWFVALLAPAFLTTEGLPHALRSIGALPIVLIFAARAIDTYINYLRDTKPQIYETFGTALLVAFFTYVGIFGLAKYHLVRAAKPQAAVAFHKPLTDIAEHLHFTPTYDEKVIIAGPLERLSIQIYTKDVPHVTYLYPDQLDLITLDNQTIYLPTYSEEIYSYLTTKFGETNIIVERHERSHDAAFWTIRKRMQ